jgi:hypothetical protein
MPINQLGVMARPACFARPLFYCPTRAGQAMTMFVLFYFDFRF